MKWQHGYLRYRALAALICERPAAIHHYMRDGTLAYLLASHQGTCPSLTDQPPSTASTCPVMNFDPSPRRSKTASSRSSGRPIRPPSSGCLVLMNFIIVSSPEARCDIGVSTKDAAITLNRIFSFA